MVCGFKRVLTTLTADDIVKIHKNVRLLMFTRIRTVGTSLIPIQSTTQNNNNICYSISTPEICIVQLIHALALQIRWIDEDEVCKKNTSYRLQRRQKQQKAHTINIENKQQANYGKKRIRRNKKQFLFSAIFVRRAWTWNTQLISLLCEQQTTDYSVAIFFCWQTKDFTKLRMMCGMTWQSSHTNHAKTQKKCKNITNR